MTESRGLAVTAALFGLTAVVFAAAGAHVLPPESVDSRRLWGTALQMHFFHAAALLAIAALAATRNAPGIRFGGWIIAIGALLFCGTLYLRAAGFDLFPGPLTPFGGGITMLGWCVLIVTLIRKG